MKPKQNQSGKTDEVHALLKCQHLFVPCFAFYTLTQVSTKSQGYKNRSLFAWDVFFPYFLLFLKIHKKLKVRYVVAQYKKNVLGVHTRSLFIVWESLSLSVLCPFLRLHSSTLSWVAGAFSPSVERVVDEIKGSVLCDLVSLGQPLHEVDFPLMLPGFGALAGSAFACEGHVPAFVLHIL